MPEIDRYFEVIRVSTWSEAKEIFGTYAGLPWAFRGQADANWTLLTTIERVSAGFPILEIESLLFREFMRGIGRYVASPTVVDNPLERLAFMQHHGVPTRLLDVTFSPYVAAYFALENTESDSAVWAINANWLRERTTRCLRIKDERFTNLQWEQMLLDPLFWGQSYDAIFRGGKNPLVCPVESFTRNERQAAQSGHFLCYADPRVGFETNLLALGGVTHKWVRKIVLPVGLRSEALWDLRQMNVTRASLFPGLDGFCASLKVLIDGLNPEYMSEWKQLMESELVQIRAEA